MRIFITAIIVLVLAVAGYFGLLYLKDRPPEWLIKLVTHTDPPPPLPEGTVAPITVPEGFSATIFARDLTGPRVMTRDPNGTMLVSETLSDNNGNVIALPDTDGNGVADETITVLSGLNQPHGISVICNPVANPPCTLYVAETGSLKAYTYDADTMRATNPRELATYPGKNGHFTRTLLPTPDGKGLYISIGSSCNVCREANALRATIQLYDIATGQMTEYARGLRNSVFMALNPVSGELWATENSRDLLGDDVPPDELNIIRKGGNYGWPICYGANIHDTDFDKNQYIRDPCADSLAPHVALQAHSAALGLAFVPEEGWPDGWGNDALVAFHGSWNRSTPTGYKVVRIHLDANGNQSGTIQDFITGFLPEGSSDTDDAIGRPVGLMAEPGGVLYVSDDRAGAIYRITLNEAPR